MHVIPGLGTGGAENMLAALVTAKRERPFDQAVVNLLSGGAVAETVRAAGIPIFDLGINHAATFWLGARRLARLIDERRPSTIQSWLYYGDLISYWALRLSGHRSTTRLYWGIRCSEGEYGLALRLASKACAHWSAEPDAVVANSYAGRETHYRLGYRPRAFTVIPNGIDIQKFRPDPAARAIIRAELGIADETPVILHAARLDPMKDHATLLQVAAQLPDLRFVLAGAGTQTLSSCPPNIIALGLRRDMPSLYAAADVAVSTSAFGEGFPSVIGEAMACGIPVAATDVGDARLIVGDTGIIVPPRDVTAMTAAIRTLAWESDTSHQHRSTAVRQNISANFSLDKAVAAFDALHLHGNAASAPTHHQESRLQSGCRPAE